jgi:hypothetical protein
MGFQCLWDRAGEGNAPEKRAGAKGKYIQALGPGEQTLIAGILKEFYGSVIDKSLIAE